MTFAGRLFLLTNSILEFVLSAATQKQFATHANYNAISKIERGYMSKKQTCPICGAAALSITVKGKAAFGCFACEVTWTPVSGLLNCSEISSLPEKYVTSPDNIYEDDHAMGPSLSFSSVTMSRLKRNEMTRQIQKLGQRARPAVFLPNCNLDGTSKCPEPNLRTRGRCTNCPFFKGWRET